MKTSNITLFFLFIFSGFSAFSQTYDVYITNRKIISARSMEFDVYIRSTGNTAPWAFRLYQSGYRFGAGFVNGGALSAAYVSGSSDLESSFGKTWGFSYNAANRILNQSSNIGSICPGAVIANTPRRIGTFRVTNTANWGCADDSMRFVTSGSGYLTLSIGKYNSTDCSNPYSSLVTSGARPFTDSSCTLLRASSDNRILCDSAEVLISAIGGLAPYSGTGVFRCGSGINYFDVGDSRGCVARVTDTVNIIPLATSFSDTACDSYFLPWSDTPVFVSGEYTHNYVSSKGCDSTVVARITIDPNNSSVSFDTITASMLPYYWNSISCTAEGNYRAILKNKWGCDSIAILFLSVKGNTDTCNPGHVTSQSSDDTICAGSAITLGVFGELPVGASWNWYENDCDNGAFLGSGPVLQITPAETTLFYVKAQGGNCITTNCGYIKINVRNIPHVPSSITGQNSGLCLAQNIQYAVIPDSNANSWQWYAPAGVSINSGQGTPSIFASFSSSLSSGNIGTSANICVNASNQCGSSQFRCAYLSLRPSLSGGINGPSVLQKGQSALFWTDSAFGVNRYSWTVPSGWRIINGQGGSAVTVKAGGAGGNIRVAASNACGQGNEVSKIVSIWAAKAETSLQPGKPELKIWPNPSQGKILIKASFFIPEEIDVISMYGSVIMKEPGTDKLDLCHLPAGPYLIRVSGEGFSEKRMLLLMK